MFLTKNRLFLCASFAAALAWGQVDDQVFQRDGSRRTPIPLRGALAVLGGKPLEGRVLRKHQVVSNWPPVRDAVTLTTGGPSRIEVRSEGSTAAVAAVNNILVGDPWVLAGQSNTLLAAVPPAASTLDPLERARRHDIRRDAPAVDFFEGGLLGNGAMGVVVCTRPDAVVLRFGHNEVWDIRAEQLPVSLLGTFADLWQKFKNGDRAWVEGYNNQAKVPDSKKYPRPWPCGTLLFGFDRRDAELLGHTVHLDTGAAEIRFRVGGQIQKLEVFADMNSDRLWLRMIDESGRPVRAPFRRVDVLAEGSGARGLADFPEGVSGSRAESFITTPLRSADSLGFQQLLPALVSDPAKDQAIRLIVRTSSRIEPPATRSINQLPPTNLKQDGPFVAAVELNHGLAAKLLREPSTLPQASLAGYNSASDASRAIWRDWWRRSAIALDDEYLERVWYRNLYFFNSVSRPGSVAPGLYGNWSAGNVGTVWHGEYVLDYNTQQLYWAAFSSNHVDNNLPYVNLVDKLRPVARAWARDFYGMPGVFFGQIHWPVDTPTLPVPNWGWGNIVCPTPWTVQGLWWHYLYSADTDFLRERAFAPIREAVQFLNAYMRRPDSHGSASPWKDDKFHIWPSQSPEIWHEHFGDPRFSGDGIVDLTLTKFVFHAYLEACRVLGLQTQERTLIAEVEEVLAHYPEYSTADSPRGGKVFLDVAGASADAIYNTPNTLMTVFPGEEHGLHSPRPVYETAANTWRNNQNEGGNDLVFLNLQGARLGLLDLDKFKRQLVYSELPDGAFTDMVLQVGGRYNDATPAFDYMRRMGIWVENFALPAVINECLLQGYNGELRLFPNWTAKNGSARFETLRAAGAFLVSSEYREGKVRWIRVQAEAGGSLRVVNPWPGQVSVRRGGRQERLAGTHLQLSTRRGESIEFIEEK